MFLLFRAILVLINANQILKLMMRGFSKVNFEDLEGTCWNNFRRIHRQLYLSRAASKPVRDQET
jgi:hypothetical protein